MREDFLSRNMARPIPHSGNWQRLSHGQEALWFLGKLAPHTAAYNIVLPVGVRGSLDAAAFRRALQTVVDRHPSLRTEFREEGGTPWQRPLAAHPRLIEELDAAGWSDADVERAVLERARRPFDLESDATLRTTLIRRSPDHQVLVIVVHHIVCDLWSLITVMDELRQLYERPDAVLPALPMTFADWAREQREILAGPRGEALWAYWSNELAGDLPVLDLPADRSRPALMSFRGGTVTRWIDAELTGELKRLAGRERVTPYMALLAAYQVLLHRYTGQAQFVVGSPASGRQRQEWHGIAGDFVNMVPLRADLSGAPTFRELLARVRAKVIGTIEHQDYPFSLLVDRLHTARDSSRSPIFQTTFVLQKFQRYPELSRMMLPAEDEEPIPFGPLRLEPIALAQQDGQFDVNVEMKEDERGRLAGAWKYAADLFDPDTIGRMASHFETLLRDIVANPSRRISDLRLLTDDERRAVIAQGAGPRIEPPAAATVAELFAQQAAQRGEAPAVRCGDRSMTYRQLDERATKLARALVARGAGRDRIVGVLLPRGLDFITALLAISRAGAAFLPLDVRHPQARTQQIVEASGALFVITPELLASLEAQAPADGPLPAVRGRDLAYVMYTSGSTGAPKGVMVEHRGMVNHVLAKLSDLGMTDRDVLAQNGPPTFDIVVWQCVAPLVVGGRVVVFPDEIAEDPARLMEEVEAAGVTVLQLVPSMLHAVIEESGGRPAPPELRWMVPTGEALPADLSRRWLALHPHIPLLNTYGSTECSDDQCHYALAALDAAYDAAAITSIGTPIRNTTAYVLDRDLEPVPAGVVGELYIGGAGVGRGYLNDPVRTAVAFVPDPFSDVPGSRMYRTRDMARRRVCGKLDFLGRTDDVIKLRGFRIEPGEIEAALCRHHAVRDAAVVARANPNGERMLVAYLVCDDVVESELRAFVAERVPQYMVPSKLIAIESLPLTPNGKVDARALPPPQWQVEAAEALVAPRTAAEETLAAIWREVLGLEAVGVTQDFFAIGGDSIRSVQIVARSKRAGLHIRPSDLFQHSTIAALAAFAELSQPQDELAPAALQVSAEHLELALQQVAFDQES